MTIIIGQQVLTRKPLASRRPKAQRNIGFSICFCFIVSFLSILLLLVSPAAASDDDGTLVVVGTEQQQNHQQQIGDADDGGKVMPVSVPETEQQQEQKQQQQQHLVNEEGPGQQEYEQSAHEEETSCDIHSNEPLHALMDRICELCHDMYSHQRPNMRADCRSDCFRNVDFKRCLRLFRPMASSNRPSAAGRGFRHWAAATMDTTLIF